MTSSHFEGLDTSQLPPAVAGVFITDQLMRRPAAAPDYLREKLAIQDLAQRMANQPAELLPRLVQLALDICDADAGGISVLEGEEFRWFNLKGRLSVFEGTTTPVNFSPCGICLSYRTAILMERPERVYDWIAEAKITVPEVLLVPLIINGTKPLGTLWIIAKDGQQFNRSHARVMTELATFTGLALHTIQSGQRPEVADGVIQAAAVSGASPASRA
jgi:GAF domain-containing protein